MRLTQKQIESVLYGALFTENLDGVTYFRKCTKRQTEAFAALHKDLGERSCTTSGVCLDFHTDSKHLIFSALQGRKFELYLNGLLYKQFDFDLLREAGKYAEIDLNEGTEETRVTIVFPSHTVGVLDFVELDDGATLRPHRFDRKFLFIGDSITQGWNSDYDSLSYAWRVSRFFNAESVIQGIGGAYYHETIFDSLPFDPDTVILALGTNDFSHYKEKEEMRAQVAAFLSLAAKEYAKKRILVLSPIWRSDQEKTLGSFEEARSIVIEEAKRLGLCHIDGLSLVPHMPEMMKDGYLHPNDLGFSLFSENLIKAMLKLGF